jgi:glutamate carboxypeptidase
MDLQILKDLVGMNSYSTNKIGVDRKQEYIWERISQLPISRELYEDNKYGDMMVIRTDENSSSKPTIGLILHTDTVHKPEMQTKPTIVGNKLYGPGSSDMQGSIFSVIKLLYKLHRDNLLQNIIIAFNTAEEKGSPVHQGVFKKIAGELDYGMVYESSSSKGTSPGTDAFNRTFQLVTSRKGIFQQVIETKGPGGHSGTIIEESERKNAITQAIKMMSSINDLANYSEKTTVNLAYVKGGQEDTIIADNSKFIFDVRYQNEQERQRVKNGIEEIKTQQFVPGVDVIDRGYNYDLPSLPKNDNSKEFINIAKRAATKVGIEIGSEQRGGWSDACNLFYYNNNLHILDGFGPKGEGEHTKNEFVYIDSIEPAVELSHSVISLLLS